MRTETKVWVRGAFDGERSVRAWMRSQVVIDTVQMTISGRKLEGWSYPNRLIFFSWLDSSPTLFRWESIPVREVDRDELPATLAHYRGTLPGFLECNVPYWSLVMPITLLSAYLIFSKPR